MTKKEREALIRDHMKRHNVSRIVATERVYIATGLSFGDVINGDEKTPPMSISLADGKRMSAQPEEP